MVYCRANSSFTVDQSSAVGARVPEWERGRKDTHD